MALNDLQESDYLKRKRQEADADFNAMANVEPERNVLRDLPMRQNNSLNEPKTQALYEPPKLSNINNPVIRETPNAQRDKDLGKMTATTIGNKTTYGIDGDTLSVSLSENDQKLKDNLTKINEMLASGREVTPDQMQRINQLRQDAGFLRGGTDRRPVGPDGRPITPLKNINAGRVGNLDVQFTDSPDNTEARKREFLEPSSYAQSQIDLIRPTVTRNIPGTNQYEVTTGQSVEDKRLAGENQQRKLEQLALDPKMVDTASEVKLRNIQGQVLQEPPLKPKASKWEMKKIGDATIGTEQDILFNEDGRSIPINPPPKAGAAVMDAVYQSPRGPVVYKGLNKDGKAIYVPFNG